MKMDELEAEMHEQEQRWEASRREMENRQSGLTEATHWRGTDSADTRTVSDGWESGIGEQRSARWASGTGDEMSARWVSGIGSETKERWESALSKENRRSEKSIPNENRRRWESGVESLSELPRWRDPVTSLIEKVREKTKSNSTESYPPGGPFSKLDRMNSA